MAHGFKSLLGQNLKDIGRAKSKKQVFYTAVDFFVYCIIHIRFFISLPIIVKSAFLNRWRPVFLAWVL